MCVGLTKYIVHVISFNSTTQHNTVKSEWSFHRWENWAQEVEKVPQTQAPRINTIVGSLTVCRCWSHRGRLNGLALCGALGSSDLAGIKMQSRDWKQSCPLQPWSLTVTSRREPVACQHLPANPSRNYPIFTLKWNVEISHLSSIPQAQEFKDLPQLCCWLLPHHSPRSKRTLPLDVIWG